MTVGAEPCSDPSQQSLVVLPWLLQHSSGLLPTFPICVSTSPRLKRSQMIAQFSGSEQEMETLS